MRTGAIAALALVLLASSPFPAHGESPLVRAEDGHPLVVVIARQRAIDDGRVPDCDDCIVMDVTYTATYEVIERIEGDEDAATIEFTANDHYGFPRFATTRTALLFLHRTDAGYVLEKYQGFAVDPTADGGWAMCLNPGPDAGGSPDLHPHPVRFADTVVFDDVSRWTDEAIATEYPAPVYEIRAGKVHCTRGVTVDEFVRAWHRR